MESISKQIIYKLVLEKVDELSNLTAKNSFIIPDETKIEFNDCLTYDDVKITGSAGFDKLGEYELIDLFFIPPGRLFKSFLENKTIDFSTVYN